MSFGNLAADPRRLAAGFLRAALKRGAKLYAPVEVTDVKPRAASVKATTKAVPAITARHLIFATGYEIPDGVPRKDNSIVSTYVIATASQPHALWEGQCLIWEASDPYLYLRTTSDGRVICGGEDEEFSDEAKRDALLAEKTAALEKSLRALPPLTSRGLDRLAHPRRQVRPRSGAYRA